MVKLLIYIPFTGVSSSLSLGETDLFTVFDSSDLCNILPYILKNGKYYSYQSACHINDDIIAVYNETSYNLSDLIKQAVDLEDTLKIQVI